MRTDNNPSVNEEPPMMIELGGHRFNLRVTDEVPSYAGKTYRQIVNGDTGEVWRHRSVTPGQSAALLAEAMGIKGPVIWRLASAADLPCRPLPVMALSR